MRLWYAEYMYPRNFKTFHAIVNMYISLSFYLLESVIGELSRIRAYLVI